jgi:Holliday junction resolvase RusA-like endonuclease
MKGRLKIKPLSINAAFQGRRFKTKECNSYCNVLEMMLPRQKSIGEYYELHLKFHLKNFARTDEDNLVKLLQDCMVKKGMISDDRKIVKHILEKFPATFDWIEWEILPADKPKEQDYARLSNN